MSRLKKGFTLIELILGLSIFSVIALVIFSTFFAGLGLMRRSEGQNDVYREARWTFSLMSREFENMVPYDFSNSYDDKNAFVGSDKKTTFLLGTPQGLKVVSYYLVPPESRVIHSVTIGETYSKNVAIQIGDQKGFEIHYLVREEQDFVKYIQEKSEMEAEVIAINIKEGGLRFSYAYLDDPESQNIIWKDQWDESYLPANIRFELEFVTTEKNNKVIMFDRDVVIPHGSWGIVGSDA